MEVFLYRCELCGTVKIFDDDYGRIHYVNQCGDCKGWAYYEKVIIGPVYDDFEAFQRKWFMVEGKKDDTKKEEPINEY